MEILRLLVRGQSTKEIVGLMKLSMGTIRLHISIFWRSWMPLTAPMPWPSPSSEGSLG